MSKNKKFLDFFKKEPNLLILSSSLRDTAPFFAYQNTKNYDLSLFASSQNLLFLLTFLKAHIPLQYSLLVCISGVDLLKSNYRFLISYEFLSFLLNARIRIKLFTNEHVYTPSVVDLFINANWWEREIWDLYGLFFDNHPDLRRILTDYGFEGYPLRKDFPIFGFKEIRYDNKKKAIVSDFVLISQDFRNFNYEKPW